METAESFHGLRGVTLSLVQEGRLTRDQVLTAADEATREKISLLSQLVKQDLVSAREVAEKSAVIYGLPLLNLEAVEVDALPTNLADRELIRKHRALPLSQRAQRLFLAVSDPTNLKGIEEMRFHTGLIPELVLVEDDKLSKLIDQALPEDENILGGVSEEELVSLDNIDVTETEDKALESYDGAEDAPIVRYINKILLDAINRAASDIHFEPYEKFYRIRYRLDGLLHEIAAPPVNMGARLASRLKVMARLNIAERRVPQDGRVRLQLSKKRNVDFRVNTCPTLHGEKIVMRILESQFGNLDLSAIGMNEHQLGYYKRAISKPYGMVLVTGPTGSGKTVSLYSALNMLNESEVNISTVEDPVEIQLPGANQVNINLKAGLTFASALRAFLRQDPDIIMVGEIRDLETAEIAIKAAQTGHLVLSTLHTNDAPQTLTRLANMGVPPFNIASSVLLIMAQRLVRKLCNHCKAAEELPREAMLREGFSEQDIDSGLTLYHPVGCDRCTQGYRGRTGIFQVMPVSDTMERLILENGTSLQLDQQAKAEGIWDLRRSGLEKVKAGITSLEELNRVTKD
jgi:type IV pilus assembly protein PilB